MRVNLLTPGGFDFHQDDAWPNDTKEGYPMATEEPPSKQWHFVSRVRERRSNIRIAAIMAMGEGQERPDVGIKENPGGRIKITALFSWVGCAAITSISPVEDHSPRGQRR